MVRGGRLPWDQPSQNRLLVIRLWVAPSGHVCEKESLPFFPSSLRLTAPPWLPTIGVVDTLLPRAHAPRKSPAPQLVNQENTLRRRMADARGRIAARGAGLDLRYLTFLRGPGGHLPLASSNCHKGSPPLHRRWSHVRKAEANALAAIYLTREYSLLSKLLFYLKNRGILFLERGFVNIDWWI